jgi:hypothetical protein
MRRLPSGLEDLVQVIAVVGPRVPVLGSLEFAPSISRQIANIVDSLQQGEQESVNEVSGPLGGHRPTPAGQPGTFGLWQQASNYVAANCGPGNARRPPAAFGSQGGRDLRCADSRRVFHPGPVLSSRPVLRARQRGFLLAGAASTRLNASNWRTGLFSGASCIHDHEACPPGSRTVRGRDRVYPAICRSNSWPSAIKTQGKETGRWGDAQQCCRKVRSQTFDRTAAAQGYDASMVRHVARASAAVKWQFAHCCAKCKVTARLSGGCIDWSWVYGWSKGKYRPG